MPYPPILRDSQGSPIPQIWDGANWKPYKANTPLVTTHQNAATANGNGVAADVDGYGSAMFQVTGTFNAKVNFEGSVDGVNYVPIFVLDSSGSRVSSATAPGIFRADIAGLKSIRAPISNYVSGAVTVVSRALPVARPTEQTVLLNGSLVQPADYTTTDTLAVAFTLDNLPQAALVQIKNTGANPARLSTDIYLDGADVSRIYFPLQNALAPAGQTVLIPVRMFKKVVVKAQSHMAGAATTLRCRVQQTSVAEQLVVPWECSWTTPSVGAGATQWENGIAVLGLGYRKVAVLVKADAAHTFTAKCAWGVSGAAGIEGAVDTLADGALATLVKYGLLEAKASHMRVGITNSDTVAHTYTITVGLIP